MKRASIILFIFTLVLLSILIITHLSDRETVLKTLHPTVEPRIDSAAIDTVAVQAIEKIKKVDSLLQQDRVKETRLLEESQRIKDSIVLTDRKFTELKKQIALEKKVLQEKYEKHIETIYETNRISRGGPEDTIISVEAR